MIDLPMHIGVEKIDEHEDGSATYTFHMSDKASAEMQQLGLKMVLYCGVAGVDIEDAFTSILDRGEYLSQEPPEGEG